MSGSGKLPGLASDAVLKQSIPVPEDFQEVKGIDYSQDNAYNMRAKDLIKSMSTMGFQASSLSQACDIIDNMRSWRGKHKDTLEEHEQTGEFDDEGYQNHDIHGLYIQFDFIGIKRYFTLFGTT